MHAMCTPMFRIKTLPDRDKKQFSKLIFLSAFLSPIVVRIVQGLQGHATITDAYLTACIQDVHVRVAMLI